MNILSAILLIFTFSQTSFAEDGRRRGGPPPVAFESCEGLSSGDSCSFEGRRGSVNGTCVTGRRSGGELVCKPERQRRAYRRHAESAIGGFQ